MKKVTIDNGKAVLYLGDNRQVLPQLPKGIAQLVCTSPPYYGLRDYETAVWEGGDPACDHKGPSLVGGTSTSALGSGDGTGGRKRSQGHLPPKGRGTQNPQPMRPNVQPVDGAPHRGGARQRTCPKCGATCEDRQIGLEESIQEYVDALVEVSRGVRHVLRDDGLYVLNLGDSYNSSPPGNKPGTGRDTSGLGGNSQENITKRHDNMRHKPVDAELGPKNLLGIPWRVALALQDDGWIWRGWLPWVKRGAMPESVEDRPATALEVIHLFSKQPHYYWDMEAVRRPSSPTSHGSPNVNSGVKNTKTRMDNGRLGQYTAEQKEAGRSMRNADLWFQSAQVPNGLVGVDDELVGLDVGSESFPGAHFAVFPQGVVRPFVLAATSQRGCCPDCGAPWKRLVLKDRKPTRPGAETKVNAKPVVDRAHHGLHVGNRDPQRHCTETRSLGWYPGCSCYGVELPLDEPRPAHKPKGLSKEALAAWQARADAAYAREYAVWVETARVMLPTYEALQTVPCLVLDPFGGAMTTPLVALKLGRYALGVELSPKYLKLGYDRLIHRGKVERALPGDKPKRKGLFT